MILCVPVSELPDDYYDVTHFFIYIQDSFYEMHDSVLKAFESFENKEVLHGIECKVKLELKICDTDTYTEPFIMKPEDMEHFTDPYDSFWGPYVEFFSPYQAIFSIYTKHTDDEIFSEEVNLKNFLKP